MTSLPDAEIRRIRLSCQRMTSPCEGGPAAAVEAMGAVQSQDYRMAKWAVGLRCAGCREPDADASFDRGDFLRIHVMRPTWHFVSKRDVRWILDLTAPNIAKAVARYESRGVFTDDLGKAVKAVADELSVGRMARRELAKRLEARGVRTDEGRMYRIMIAAEVGGVACCSGREGRDFCYALLDDVADGGALSRDDAVARLAETYFASRGPATASDFSWWSGLSAADARKGMDCLGGDFEIIGPKEREMAYRDAGMAECPERGTFLMPDYDEWVLAYRDRSAVSGLLPLGGKAPINADRDKRVAIARGQICGSWTVSGGVAAAEPFAPMGDDVARELESAASRYMRFIG